MKSCASLTVVAFFAVTLYGWDRLVLREGRLDTFPQQRFGTSPSNRLANAERAGFVSKPDGKLSMNRGWTTSSSPALGDRGAAATDVEAPSVLSVFIGLDKDGSGNNILSHSVPDCCVCPDSSIAEAAAEFSTSTHSRES